MLPPFTKGGVISPAELRNGGSMVRCKLCRNFREFHFPKLSGTSLGRSDRTPFGGAKRRKGAHSPRSADSCDPVMEPIRSFQTVSPRTWVNTPALTPWHPLVATKIILLGDVPILTILYAVLVVGVSDRRTHTRSLRL